MTPTDQEALAQLGTAFGHSMITLLYIGAGGVGLVILVALVQLAMLPFRKRGEHL